MPTPIKMPALSPTMEEGTLSKWLVKEGDDPLKVAAAPKQRVCPIGWVVMFGGVLKDKETLDEVTAGA